MPDSFEEILDFWFGDFSVPDYPPRERSQLWFGKSESDDRLIRERFSATLERAARGEYDGWKSDPRGRLALILVFDQFPRNIYRDTPRAFAFDPKAQALATEGIEQGSDTALNPFDRVFFYLPLEHAEDPQLQRKSVERYRRLIEEAPPELLAKLSGYLDYAVRHAQVIERFGRFPHRNRILGRVSTPQETEYLKEPGSSF
ncbi:MAG: DUF924 family protein [Burkholderiales bacterium]